MKRRDHLSDWMVLGKDLEIDQVSTQVLRGLKMNGGKSQRLRLLNIRQGIVDKQTFVRWSANPLEKDLKDLRVRLDVSDLAGNDHIIK